MFFQIHIHIFVLSLISEAKKNDGEEEESIENNQWSEETPNGFIHFVKKEYLRSDVKILWQNFVNLRSVPR